MALAWDAAGTLPVVPPDDFENHDALVTGQGMYWECGANDSHLMFGWFAGPETLLRYPDTREHYWTIVEADGSDRARQPVSDQEQRQAHDDTNERLREYGIPALPYGFRWFQLVPPGGTGRDVIAAGNGALSKLPRQDDAAMVAAHVRAAVEQLYGLPVTAPPAIPPQAGELKPEHPRVAARRSNDQGRMGDLLPGPSGAVPILQCRSLSRSLPFYKALGFRVAELPGYAVLQDGPTELHLSQTSNAAAGGCLIRVDDARKLWQRLQGHDNLGPLDDAVPGMLSFALSDPDGSRLIFVSRR